MHKSFKWILSLIVTVFALSITGSTVFAEKDGAFEDGEYDIDYSVNYEGDDSPVDVDSFFEKPATLKVEDGKQSIQLKYTSTNMIVGLEVPNAEVEIIEDDEDAETRVVSIKTDADLTESLDMGLEMFYGQTHDVVAEFDVSDVPEKSEEPEEDKKDSDDEDGEDNSSDKPDNEKPDDSNKDNDQGNDKKDKDKKDEGTQNNDKKDGDKQNNDKKEQKKKTKENKDAKQKSNDDSKVTPEKAFQYDYTVKHETEDKASAANEFFQKPATVLHKDGEKYIQVTVTSWEMIDDLKADNNDVKVIEENGDGSVLIQFKVDGDLSDTIPLNMKVTVPGLYSEDHTARMILDMGSEKKVDANQFNIYLKGSPASGNGDSKKETNKAPQKQENNATSNDSGESGNTTAKATSGESNIQWDKAFEYDYVVKHATEDKVSAADKFFKKPATVLYKGDEKYIQLTITNWEWIKSITPESGEVTVVQVNDDGSAVIQFKVNGDLSDAIVLDMHVVVPEEVAGMPYDMNHTARIFLDLDSEKEVNPDDYATTVLGGEDGKVPNPQTGDSTNVWYYALLLMGSIIVPSGMLVKRRFAHK